MTTKRRPVDHATFTLERTYKASPARVFAAWQEPELKRRWFVEGEGWEVDHYTMDFRVGGLEGGAFRFRGGPVVENHSVYLDIVPGERIVAAYTMVVGGARISSSLATTELRLAPDGKGTTLVYTEQAAFFEGSDGVKGREGGCRELLEKLAAFIDA